MEFNCPGQSERLMFQSKAQCILPHTELECGTPENALFKILCGSSTILDTVELFLRGGHEVQVHITFIHK